MNHKFRHVVAALALSASALGVAGAEIIEQILVRVNGEIFTKSEFEARQVTALRQIGQQVDPSTTLGDAQLRKMIEEVTPELIVNVVDEMLIVQRGRELGYRLGDDQFQSILTNIKTENKLETDEAFEAALKQENMTMADLRRSLERQMIISRVRQNEVLGRIAVSDQEARRYYDSHLDDFTTPGTITLREIFVSVPGDGLTLNVGVDEAAAQKASQIHARALAGESFEKLAADLSDAPSKANAGLIGPLNLGDLAPDLRKIVEAMKVGNVSEILRTPRGYQILKLESSTPAETMSFEQAREDIGNRVFTDKQLDEFDKFMGRLRAEAIIEWKHAELEKAYQRGLERVKEQAKNRTPGAGN